MSEAKVSVIIPTFNREATIGRAIESVLAQSYESFELIIVDGASTDDTEGVVRNYNDERITYIKQQKNRGVSTARNRGIKVSEGKFIAFLDSDDEWLQEKLGKQIHLIQRVDDRVGVVYTGLRKINKKGQIKKTKLPKYRGDIRKHLLSGNVVGNTSTVVAKIECFKKAGFFDERMPSSEDWDMWLRISNHFAFDHIREPLVNYHIQDQRVKRISDDLRKILLGYRIMLGKYKDDPQLVETLKSEYYHILGNLLCSAGKMKQGRKCFVKSISHRPLKVNNAFRFFEFLFGKEFDEIIKEIC